MIIDSKKMNGPCVCGRTHLMSTKIAIIEPGCMENFEHYLKEYGLSSLKRAAIYDENTYHAKGLVRPRASQEIILNPKNLHANEISTSDVLNQLSPDVQLLIAVGSGTIHDTTRFCAKERNIPFIACPTAASVDGFCSTVSAMTWHGFKKTLPGVAPELVLADINVIRQAPLALALSGVGDIFGKYTALADWKIAHALTGEFICSRIEGMTRNAVEAVHKCCTRLSSRDPQAYEQLTYALLLSGLAMQLMGNSRPASGCEHHISHIIEMQPPGIPNFSTASHGEKVGVGTILCSAEYHRLSQISNIATHIIPYGFPSRDELQVIYGAQLCESIYKENQEDCMKNVTVDDLIRTWDKICDIINEIPTSNELIALYTKIGAKKTLEDIEISPHLLPLLFKYSPTVRNRLTFNRVRWMIKE